jgi:uncharacterized protein (TIGR02677 family)
VGGDPEPDDPNEIVPDGPAHSALIAEIAQAERLRLFAWATRPEHKRYLAVLRALDRLRASYTARARPIDVAEALGEASAGEELDDLVRLLDQLADDGMLDQSHDAGRVTSVAEYRRRRPVFQFTEVGYRAYRSVEDILGFQPGESSLRRLALVAIAEDLLELAEANEAADAVRVHRLLHQLDLVFTDMADQAANFYVLLGQLTQQHEAEPEVFLELKDRLLAYLREFLAELQRCRPLVASSIARVEATGVDELIERVVEADDAPFLSPVERRNRWRVRWDGLVGWFVGDGTRAPAAAELDRATTRAIADLAALLRRLTEVHGRGLSRAAELEHLAGWLAAVPSDDAATALFGAAFGLAPVRHLSIGTEEVDRDTPSTSWWTGEPVVVPATLRERGKHPGPAPPQPLPDLTLARQRARLQHEARQANEAAAVSALRDGGISGRVLEAGELRVLLTLLDRALRARVPVSGTVAHADGRLGPLRIRLAPSDGDTVVKTVHGVLTLQGLAVEVLAA